MMKRIVVFILIVSAVFVTVRVVNRRKPQVLIAHPQELNLPGAPKVDFIPSSNLYWSPLDSINIRPLKGTSWQNTITLTIGDSEGEITHVFKAGRPSFMFQKSGVASMYYFESIKSIKAVDKDHKIWNVTLNNGQKFQASWVNVANIYGGNVIDSFVAEFYIPREESLEIELSKLLYLKILVVPIKGSEVSNPEKPGPVNIELKNGQVVNAPGAFINDICGEFGRTFTHQRYLACQSETCVQKAKTLDENKPTIEEVRANAGAIEGSGVPDPINEMFFQSMSVPIDPEKVKKITFTGKFSKRFPACREIIVEFRNGKSKKTNLFLTGESYGGLCSAENERFNDMDEIGSLTKYGAWYIPLDSVASITYP